MKALILSFLLLFYFPLANCQSEMSSINVASYNLRYNTPNDGENAWPNRKENVKDLIRYHDFDIFGTQEGLRDQLEDIAELEVYSFVGVGRDDGISKGEHSAIFYKKDRFKVLELGDFWLSETPNKPGKGWDATCCNRICSWAKFEDVNTKKQFYFFNAHFDHQGVQARRESGKLMIKKMKEIAKDQIKICTGDFNSTPETEQIINLQSYLNDSYLVSKMPPYGPVGTSNGFKIDAELKNRIDYVFVSKEIEVLKYAVLSDFIDHRFPSDHNPVLVKVLIK